ncbi:MAG: Tex family protein [bacterium]
MNKIIEQISKDIAARDHQVKAAIELLDEGSTVPFIARYRKEVTGGLDDSQLRLLDERLVYLRELEQRRSLVIEKIQELGFLDDVLKKQIEQAETKTRLEDLYLPYKPKRRTKAQMAREAGLQPLADKILEKPHCEPTAFAQEYLTEEIKSAEQALEGARYILLELISERANLVELLRENLWSKAFIFSSVIKGKESEGQKFKDYFSFEEKLNKVPSHRALALFRGRQEGLLRLKIDLPNLEEVKVHPFESQIISEICQPQHSLQLTDWFAQTVKLAWKAKLHTRIGLDLFARLQELAEQEAINVFRRNLNDLLLAAPAGPKVVLALDPGIRTGVKVAVMDQTGKVLSTDTIYPFQPKNQVQQSLHTLAAMCKMYEVELVAIGNGTGSRETEKLIAQLNQLIPERKLTSVVVSEAGASVYSASQLAADEFPELDVSLRGAVSIGRRLQDPLAELVKIEPKAIGVGQYQHDVNQLKLSQALDATVEDCVNSVGVDLNSASVPLLAQVAGLNKVIAKHIVQWRDENGRFENRKQLLNVSRLGPKAYQQSAGFLRIKDGLNPLDASAVHPEAYPLVQELLSRIQKSVDEVVGHPDSLSHVQPGEFVSEQFGLPTVRDILEELKKPGRDPRPKFKVARFAEGVEQISDLTEGMQLEGVISNVTNFGAFVDIGVHQDGLVHISQLADQFVKDPHQIVKAGDIVKVRVKEIDPQRKRIALSMKSEQKVDHHKHIEKKNKEDKNQHSRAKQKTSVASRRPAGGGALADAFKRAIKK